MRRPTLHLLAIPHTVTRPEFSHCAFTGKVEKLSPMMRKQGYDVIHYGVEGALSGATEDVNVLEASEFAALLGHDYTKDPSGFVGTHAVVSSPVYRQFNYNARQELKRRVQPGDLVLCPFGKAHEAAVRGLDVLNRSNVVDQAWAVESGIGYPEAFLEFRIYESEAWRSRYVGAESRQPRDYEFVIPNYFDAAAWDLGGGEGDYVLYFGRITELKGLLIFAQMARYRPDLRFVMCGQGDPTEFLAMAPNLEYLPPVHGRARSKLLGEALAMVTPSRYLEPFGGVTVEAHLTGTPTLGSTFGSFTETIVEGVDGYRCRTLGDWLAALEILEEWHHSSDRMARRERIRNLAVERYGFDAVGRQYDNAFRVLTDLNARGWLTLRSSLGPVTKALEPKDRDPADLPADPAGAWARAQRFELGFWLSSPDVLVSEVEKQNVYLDLLKVPRVDLTASYERMPRPTDVFDFGDKRVLDVGCGPVSVLLRSRTKSAVALDPLDFGEKLEAAYRERGVARAIMPGEELVTTVPFDEVILYNCLQHAEDPRTVLANVKAAVAVGGRVRLFEWLNIPTDVGHLHVLTEELFAFAFDGWTRVEWAVGRLDNERPHLVGDYIAAVLERPADPAPEA